jgi:hypothetical protein
MSDEIYQRVRYLSWKEYKKIFTESESAYLFEKYYRCFGKRHEDPFGFLLATIV